MNIIKKIAISLAMAGIIYLILPYNLAHFISAYSIITYLFLCDMWEPYKDEEPKDKPFVYQLGMMTTIAVLVIFLGISGLTYDSVILGPPRDKIYNEKCLTFIEENDWRKADTDKHRYLKCTNFVIQYDNYLNRGIKW